MNLDSTTIPSPAASFQTTYSNCKKMNSLIAVLIAIIGLASAHVRTWEPPGRSTLWRDPRFTHLNPAENTADDGIYCGRIYQPPVVDNCGVCGDPVADLEPRPNESGGIYGQGIIAGNFSAGQNIPLALEVTIPHNGSIHFQICDEIPETDACFFRRPKLNITTDLGTFEDFPVAMDKIWVNGTLQLPMGVSCRQCVLRLNYRSGLMGECEDGTNDYGCGMQQNFRTCSDVSISL